VILTARNRGVLDEYMALKRRKREAERQGRQPDREDELAWSFGRLLSYSEKSSAATWR